MQRGASCSAFRLPQVAVDQAFVTVVTPNAGEPLLEHGHYRQGLRSLHCSLQQAEHSGGISLARIPLIVLAIGFQLDGMPLTESLLGVRVVHLPSITEPAHLRCLLGRPLPWWWLLRSHSRLGGRRATFEKLLIWSLGDVVREALYLDIDVMTIPTAAPRLNELFGHSADSRSSFLQTWNASFAAVGFHSKRLFYFNSGVMLLKPNDLTMSALAALMVSGKYPTQDANPGEQDLLQSYWSDSFRGAAAQRSRGAISPRAPKGSAVRLPGSYNIRPQSWSERMPSDSVLVHFAGEPKPWTMLNMPGLWDAAGGWVPDALADYAKTRSQAGTGYYASTCVQCFPTWSMSLFKQTMQACLAKGPAKNVGALSTPSQASKGLFAIVVYGLARSDSMVQRTIPSIFQALQPLESSALFVDVYCPPGCTPSEVRSAFAGTRGAGTRGRPRTQSLLITKTQSLRIRHPNASRAATDGCFEPYTGGGYNLHRMKLAIQSLRRALDRALQALPVAVIVARVDVEFLEPSVGAIFAHYRPWERENTVFVPANQHWGGLNDRFSFGSTSSISSFVSAREEELRGRDQCWLGAELTACVAAARRGLRVIQTGVRFVRRRADDSVPAIDQNLILKGRSAHGCDFSSSIHGTLVVRGPPRCLWMMNHSKLCSGEWLHQLCSNGDSRDFVAILRSRQLGTAAEPRSIGEWMQLLAHISVLRPGNADSTLGTRHAGPPREYAKTLLSCAAGREVDLVLRRVASSDYRTFTGGIAVGLLCTGLVVSLIAAIYVSLSAVMYRLEMRNAPVT